MTNKTLTSPEAVVGDIARLFPDDPVCSISVREDRAFSVSSHLSLGTIKLFPQEAEIDNYIAAVRSGAFEWSTPNVQAVTDELVGCLAVDKIDNQDSRLRAEDKIRRIIASIGAMPVRLGLSHPIFDPLALEDMPFQRATTVVSDTSGVVQGGLSFVSRYLHPAARIKVPAIVQMEIVNLADRFLESVRRLYVGLQSFRSMSRMDASLMKASALRLRFSQSLASPAAVEPGDGAFDHPTPGLDDEALHPIGSLDDLGLEIGQDAGQGAVKDRALIGAVGEQFPEKGKQTEQGRQQRETAVAILNVGGGDDAVQQQALRIDQNMPLLALDQLAGIEAVAVDASPPFSALFTL